MRSEIEAKLGGGAVCFFLQGAAGDINPLMLARSGDPAKDLPVVDSMGKTLATEVLSVLEKLKPAPGKSDQLLAASQSLTVDNRWAATITEEQSAKSDKPWFKKTLQTNVTVLLLNSDIGFVAMSGEPFHQFQIDWRRKSALPHAFFLGYCSVSADPWLGYTPDIESAARGGYGASEATYVAVGTGERLLNEGLAQLFTLQGRLKPKPQRHLNE